MVSLVNPNPQRTVDTVPTQDQSQGPTPIQSALPSDITPTPTTTQPVNQRLGNLPGQIDPTDLLPDTLKNTATRLWGLEQTNGPIELQRQLMAHAAQQVYGDVQSAANARQWSSLIPNIPGGIMLSLVSNGITPDSPLGAWLARSGIPALSQDTTWAQPDINNVQSLMSDPLKLAALQRLPLEQQQHLFRHGVWTVGKLNDDQLQTLEQSGKLPDQGWMGYIGDVTRPVGALFSAGAEYLAGATREAWARVLQDTSDISHGKAPSAVGLTPSIRPASYNVPGITLPSISDMLPPILTKGGIDYVANAHNAQPSDFAPNFPTSIATHTTQFTTGPEATDLADQITAVQALKQGVRSLGSGFLPSGTAAQAAVKAQQAAASVDGHALTWGRALASAVSTPGSLAYHVGSGLVDFTVATKADPAAIVLSQVSEALKAGRLFSPTTDEAINAVANHLIDNLNPSNAAAVRSWAGMKAPSEYQGVISRAAAERDIAEGRTSPDLFGSIVNKIQSNAGSLQDLVDQGVTTNKNILSAIAGHQFGLLDGLTRRINPQSALEFLNSDHGVNFAQWAAARTGTDIFLKTGMPAKVAYALGDATTPDEVRQVLSDTIGTDLRSQPYTWLHPFSSSRYFNVMPNFMSDTQNMDDAISRHIAELKLGGVPKAEWDPLLREVANAQNMPEYLKAAEPISNRVGQAILDKQPGYIKNAARRDELLAERAAQIKATGVEPPIGPELGDLQLKTKMQEDFAKNLTWYFPQNSDAQRQSWAEYVSGNVPKVPGLAVDGSAVPINEQYGVSELLNRGLPYLGGNADTVGSPLVKGTDIRTSGLEGLREIRRQVGIWHNVWQAPYVGQSLRHLNYAMDFISGAFKTGVLARLALPIRFLADEQARMASAGMSSIFHNPMSYLAWVTASPGGIGREDITGENFAAQIADHQSTVSKAIGTTSMWRDELFNPDTFYANGWTTYSQGDRNFIPSWADRLSQSHVDTVGKAVARALVDPVGNPNLDAVKAAFAANDGELADARKILTIAKLGWGSENLGQRSVSDAYVDGWVQRLNDLTGKNPDLLNAVATGEPWQGEEASKEFMRTLNQQYASGFAPQKVVGPMAVTGGTKNKFRALTNIMFSGLMSTPTTTLTRSPAFRQAYFQRVQELLPYLDDATRAQVIDRAAQNGVRLIDQGGAAGHAMTLEQADTFAKSYALQTVHDMLYYPASKTNSVDILRNIMPFANAWKNIIGSWARLAAENPVVFRRVQQGVTEAQRSGFFYTDPDTGKEVFTIVPAEGMKYLTGAAFPMVGQVQGLNIVGQGLPGFGPAIQWPVAPWLNGLHKQPVLNAVHDMMYPYGEPDFSGGVLESLFPGWLDKLRTGGYLGLWGPSGDQKRILGEVQKQAFEYLMSTGKYDLSDPAALDKAMGESMGIARKLYLWRGLAQNISPSAPSYIAQAQLRDGGLLSQYLLAKDYRSMLDAYKGDNHTATLQFVSKYGPDLIFATQPMTTTNVFGLPTTAEAEAWKSQHQEFATQYPTLYGYFTPQGGKFDHTAYLQEIADGQRTAPSGTDWWRLAEARLGNAMYGTQRSKFGGTVTKQQRQWLDQWKSYIGQQYPGFADQPPLAFDSTQVTMEKLQNAVRDPAVSNTPLAGAINTYLAARDKGLAVAKARGLSGTALTSHQVNDVRQWLSDWGSYLAQQTPAFTAIWDGLLSKEVESG